MLTGVCWKEVLESLHALKSDDFEWFRIFNKAKLLDGALVPTLLLYSLYLKSE